MKFLVFSVSHHNLFFVGVYNKDTPFYSDLIVFLVSFSIVKKKQKTKLGIFRFPKVNSSVKFETRVKSRILIFKILFLRNEIKLTIIVKIFIFLLEKRTIIWVEFSFQNFEFHCKNG